MCQEVFHPAAPTQCPQSQRYPKILFLSWCPACPSLQCPVLRPSTMMQSKPWLALMMTRHLRDRQTCHQWTTACPVMSIRANENAVGFGHGGIFWRSFQLKQNLLVLFVGMGVNHHPGHPRMMTPNSSGPMHSLSPMGMNAMGSQPLSHSMPNQMHSPNPMGPNMPPHSGPMGPGMMPHGMMMNPVSQDPGMGNNQMMQQGRMGLPHRGQGFPPGHSPPQQVPFPHNGPVHQGGFPHGMGFQGEGGPLGRMGNMPHGPGGEPGMCKPNTPGGQEFNNMPGVFSDSDLHEVMRPGASGIPEFDLSRIIPSEKPSQTLSYFPRGGDAPGGKPPHPSGFPQMQGMMGEGNPRMGLPMQGMGGPPGHMGPQDMPMGNPGHNPMRPPGFMGQGMMGPQHRMLSPGQQPGMMGGPGMMQGKERMYGHPGPVGSPNMMMSLQGMSGPQQTMMMPSQMRPRGMAADMGMGFNPGPGNPGNIMFWASTTVMNSWGNCVTCEIKTFVMKDKKKLCC